MCRHVKRWDKLKKTPEFVASPNKKDHGFCGLLDQDFKVQLCNGLCRELALNLTVFQNKEFSWVP